MWKYFRSPYASGLILLVGLSVVYVTNSFSSVRDLTLFYLLIWMTICYPALLFASDLLRVTKKVSEKKAYRFKAILALIQAAVLMLMATSAVFS